jgi:FkbM family methyltransferase
MKVLDLIKPGDIVFDIGANVGLKTVGYLEAGAGLVVCVEPQPWCANQLRDTFSPRRLGALEAARVVVETCALGSEPGRGTMLVCDQHDALSTLDPKWKTGRFAHEYTWSKTIEVQVQTLDQLIARHGRPDFVKVDVEGFEKHVVAGLSQPVPCMSIEFALEFRQDTEEAMSRMMALGFREWNMGRFTEDTLIFDPWEDQHVIQRAIGIECGGDIYGRCP